MTNFAFSKKIDLQSTSKSQIYLYSISSLIFFKKHLHITLSCRVLQQISGNLIMTVRFPNSSIFNKHSTIVQLGAKNFVSNSKTRIHLIIISYCQFSQNTFTPPFSIRLYKTLNRFNNHVSIF